MNPRTLRRAIERKQARQTQKEQSRQQAATLLATAADTFNAEYEATKASLLQLQANRRNAERSTGPKTEAGKAISSRNALKTGLTGRTVLLASEDDAILYQHHLQNLFAELHPIGTRETELTPNPSPIRNGVWPASQASNPASMPLAAASSLKNFRIIPKPKPSS